MHTYFHQRDQNKTKKKRKKNKINPNDKGDQISRIKNKRYLITQMMVMSVPVTPYPQRT